MPWYHDMFLYNIFLYNILFWMGLFNISSQKHCADLFLIRTTKKVITKSADTRNIKLKGKCYLRRIAFY